MLNIFLDSKLKLKCLKSALAIQIAVLNLKSIFNLLPYEYKVSTCKISSQCKRGQHDSTQNAGGFEGAYFLSAAVFLRLYPNTRTVQLSCMKVELCFISVLAFTRNQFLPWLHAGETLLPFSGPPVTSERRS